ncbi:MAG: TrkA family potassium uptake protein [Deltaproteobacteria bacterium]|nr:TrkA family potassium uptake protein [Deltaproteobacteria bacterium]
MKQFAVMGLGNFGFYLATRLYEKGHEVLAMDKDSKPVQEIKSLVSQALVADTTDKEAMEALGLDQMDAVVIAIGSNMSDSILTTLLMKEIGVSTVFAKAINEAHGRALRKVGASEVFFPEKDLALSVAEKLHNPNLIEFLPFIEGFSIVELAPPKEFIGKSLADLDLINRYGTQVVAIKELVPEKLHLIPTGRFLIKDSDVLILLGPTERLDELRKSTGGG